MTTDPTIKPALIDAAAVDVKVLQNLGRMKEFDPKKWVDDSYIRKAYAELKLDYDAQLKSTKNYEVSGDDKFCKKPISDPRKAGEVWVDDDGISPVQQRHLHARRLCRFQGQGKEDQRRLRLRHRRAASSCSPTRPSMRWPARAISRRSC